MQIKTKEILPRSILSRSRIEGMRYCLNPYVGCTHGCRYCYATFMKRFTGHIEPWGSFVDAKINAAEILRQQLKRAKKDCVMISSVTDAYQPVEARYKITRQCLEVLQLFRFPVSILTKSPLVLRDIDIISKMGDIEVGLTITTNDDRVRRIFEPNAPPISARINALRRLRKHGISTFVFIGPLLPMNPDMLAEKIMPYADRILIDRMNYINKTRHIFKRHNIGRWLDQDFSGQVIERLQRSYDKEVELIC